MSKPKELKPTLAPLPCPFCGCLDGYDEQGDTYRWRLWRCASCGACGPEVRCAITGSGRSQEEAAEASNSALQAWNERNPTTPTTGHQK